MPEQNDSVRVRVPREKFMAVWEETVHGLKNGTLEGSAIQIVAQRLGLKPNTVQQRATKYRTTHGIPLSTMPRSGGARFDAEAARKELEAIRARLEQVEQTES